MAMAGRLRSSTVPLVQRILRSADPLSTIQRSLIYPTSHIPSPPYAQSLIIAPLLFHQSLHAQSSPLLLSFSSGFFPDVAPSLTTPTPSLLWLFFPHAHASISCSMYDSLMLEEFSCLGLHNSLMLEEVVLAENGRLRNIETIAKRFTELTMAHRGEVKATITTVIPLPAEEEKELKETLQNIIGHGKKVKLEQKIDPNIIGGIVVEFGQKVFDMSIKTRARQMERFLREPVNFGSL
ncbi:ATP synthase subunit O, mitochondrial-like [Diospyros lotus]|uniref:ATP synthase subunit O, mitochondrial-like n=1 Tax=Diospyros lotus TaxID=55363 RepID=UPI00225B0600|nr:ATP synthase subunit O, mitochondrial-like [Diospyros lotus]